MLIIYAYSVSLFLCFTYISRFGYFIRVERFVWGANDDSGAELCNVTRDTSYLYTNIILCRSQVNILTLWVSIYI